MRIVHISGHRRQSEGSETNLGGVEKFGWYLERALKDDFEFMHYVEEDFEDGCTPEELNNYLLTMNLITINDLVIADSSFLLGIPDDFKKVCFFHGTWAQFQANHGQDPMMGLAQSQNTAAHLPNTKIVASCEGVAGQVKRFYGRDVDRIILHGIDTELFKPLRIQLTRTGRPLIVHAAKNENKGIRQVRKIKELFWNVADIQYLDAENEEMLSRRFAEANAFIHLSNYEGNAYSILEAMACNIPVLATNVGVFEKGHKGIPGVIIIDRRLRDNPYISMSLLTKLLSLKIVDTRSWVLRNATFERFRDDWIEFITNYIKE